MVKQNLQPVLLTAATCILLFILPPVFAQTKWLKAGNVPAKYILSIDSNNQREGNNVTTLTSADLDINKGFGVLLQNSKPEKYLGKRVRMTGYLKTKDVADWAGFWFRVDQANSQQFLSFDNMQNRAIKGTTDWKKYEIVLDVPAEASNIAFGALLSGTGQIWVDEVKFEIVDNSVPVTGQTNQVN